MSMTGRLTPRQTSSSHCSFEWSMSTEGRAVRRRCGTTLHEHRRSQNGSLWLQGHRSSKLWALFPQSVCEFLSILQSWRSCYHCIKLTLLWRDSSVVITVESAARTSEICSMRIGARFHASCVTHEGHHATPQPRNG